MRFSGKWSDIGTWNTLTEVMDETYVGNVIMDEKCKNTHVVNELDIACVVYGYRKCCGCGQSTRNISIR